MEKFGTCIKHMELETFNKKYNTVIDRNMSLYSVHRQLESVFNIECGFIAKTERRALETVLKSMDEYIINIETVFYLCVRDVEVSKEANNE